MNPSQYKKGFILHASNWLELFVPVLMLNKSRPIVTYLSAQKQLINFNIITAL